VRRLVRILFSTAAALSLGLFVATVALWVKGYFVTESVRWSDQRAWQCWMHGRGQMMYLRAAADGLVHMAPNRQVEGEGKRVADAQWLVRDFVRFAGFAFGRGAGMGYTGWTVVVPMWFACVTFAVLPIVGFRGWRRRRRVDRAGLCSACGYDLRATPDRCPECGAVRGGTVAEVLGEERGHFY
jgi:hypothetical protein